MTVERTTCSLRTTDAKFDNVANGVTIKDIMTAQCNKKESIAFFTDVF